MPQNISELRAFLSMLTYFGNFLPQLSTTIEPLHLLLRKGVVLKWEAAQTRAFKAAKTMLSSSALLVHYDPSKELVLSCDSSSYGIGCALLQTNGIGNLQPVAYASRTLSDTERRYVKVERQALACVWGILKMHQYVFGRHITIETDHKPLLGLLRETRAMLPTSSGCVQRWTAGYE